MQYDQPMEEVEVREGFSYVMEALTQARRPKGTQASPALNCRDLKEHNPDFQDGEYWVDPNGQTSKDAILVQCRFDSEETCIRPAPAKYDVRPFTRTTEASYFMEDITGEKDFSYKVDNSQLAHLSLASNGARQTVTFNCLNSEASVALALYNGEELDAAEGKFRKTTTVSIQDDCVKDNQWHSAIFNVRTNKTETLPITDVLLYDVGQQNQQFGIELGEVCFS